MLYKHVFLNVNEIERERQRNYDNGIRNLLRRRKREKLEKLKNSELKIYLNVSSYLIYCPTHCSPCTIFFCLRSDCRPG